MLSLTTWSRGAVVASMSLVAVCGFFVIDDELNAREARAELQDFWLPARTMNRDLLEAEKSAENSIAAFIATPNVRSREIAEHSVARLQTTVVNARRPQGDPELMLLALASHVAAAAWVATGADAITSASTRGMQARSLSSERVLTRATDAHLALLNSGASEVRRSLSHTNAVLRMTAIIETLLLICLLALLMFGLRFRVLSPLIRLREDLERSALHIAHVIRPTGPSEIAAVAHDAESMRRSLIHEQDVSDEATQALTQSSPLTLAVRAELDRHDSPVRGILGFHRPVEGLIAGDWWWAGERPTGARLFAIADVSGHGVAAGMLALESRTLVTAALMAGDSPEVICAQLARRQFASGMFLTLFIGEMRGSALTYCSAGHPLAAVVSATQASELATTGPIISALGGTWRLGQLALDEKSALLLATDGLLEAAPESNFMQITQHSWTRSGAKPRECLELLLGQARELSYEWTDDVTVMIATANP
ncbi:MAG: PP2C family protein-serine/threonine phosphatase [Actinomycetota bacterium]|nr:PP2C family protein-serine/threonine phosphatase [Actinomycetota bacterium]